MAAEILVARPKQQISRPVANGSSVPVWPALRASTVRLARCSAWLLDRPSGLSSNRTPSSICPRREAIVQSVQMSDDRPSGLAVRVFEFGNVRNARLGTVGPINQLRELDAARQLRV